MILPFTDLNAESNIYIQRPIYVCLIYVALLTSRILC